MILPEDIPMTHSKITFITIALISAMALAPMAIAQRNAGGHDETFVKKASAGGMTEVQASQLADTHSKSPDIKSFASTMVSDHSKANEQLKALAMKDGLTPSDGPNAMQQKAITRLSSLNGMAFDKAYKAMMLKDHNETIALFKSESGTGSSADLKSFASDTLPTLEHHLAMAKELK
jgi:putative membrane protein